MARQQHRGIIELLQFGKRLELNWHGLNLPAPLPGEPLLPQFKQLLPAAPLPMFSLLELKRWLDQQNSLTSQQQYLLEHNQRQLQKAVTQLASQYGQTGNNLQNAQHNWTTSLQALDKLAAQQNQLIAQAARLSQIVARMPTSHLYKDKLKQALRQADKFKQALLQNQLALKAQQEECRHAQRHLAQLRQAHQTMRHKGLALAKIRQRLSAQEQDLLAAQKKIFDVENIKCELEMSIACGQTIIKGWSVRKDQTACRHMQQAVEQAGLLANKISRWEKLLLDLERRLPKRISMLQSWHQENKNLSKHRATLEAWLQAVLAEINTDNYRTHINGELGFKLAAAKEQLNSLLEKARLLERQSLCLAKAIPQELERGRLWTEQWRLAAKEQRSLLTQATAWQQEAIEETEQSRQRLEQLNPGWNEQALQLAAWLELWPEILSQLSELKQHGQQLEQSANALQQTVIPAAKVVNLVKTPVSFKQYSAAWRRLLPEQNHLPALLGMQQTIDYWLNMLNREFSDSLLQPLHNENKHLARQLERTQREKDHLRQARQRSALHFWEIRKSKLYQQAHIGELAKLINEIGLDLNQAKNENTQLHDLLRQSRQEQALNQERIASLLEQNMAGEQARRSLEHLEDVLVNVRQEKAKQQQRLEAALGENTLLAAQKDNLYQQLLQARQDKQILSQQLAENRQEHALTQERIKNLHMKEALEQEARSEVERLRGIIRNFRRQQKQDHLQIEEIQLENSKLHGYKIKSENLASILKQMLDKHKQAQQHIDDLLDKNIKLSSGQAMNLHLQAEVFQLRIREEQYKLRIEQLEGIGLNVEVLEKALHHSRRMARALKGKMLERHRLYRESQKALAQLALQQARNVKLEVALAQLQEQISLNERALGKLRTEYQQAVRERDAARAALIQERSVRLALTQAGEVQHSLQQQLELAREEARHWQQMASDLRLALQRADNQGAPSLHWQREAARNAAKASELEEKISRLLLQVEVQAPHPRQAFSGRDQTERILSSLQQSRRRLKNVGKNILHGWALIAVLSGSLLLGTPTVSGTAALPPSPQSQLAALPGAAQVYPLEPHAVVLQNSIVANLDLRSTKTQDAPLPRWIEQIAIEVATEYSLPPESSKVNALTLWIACDNLNPDHIKTQLRAMAAQALALVDSSRHIARNLGRQALANENDLQALFYAKLFDEYRSLGHMPAQALGAISSNLWASRQLEQKALVYQGQVLPLAAIEDLNAQQFVQRISPYIENRMEHFMASQAQPYQGAPANYARNLALDIYQAAEAFAVPKTLMLGIAHQETFYANVLGDSSRSASPFQLFAPTRKMIIDKLARSGFVAPPADIRLERHLTLATYMAAFHLKQLIAKNSDSVFVYTDRLLRSYNGASVYAGLVGKRQQQLASYLAKTAE